ncbi:phage baseplate upper protein [Enterococcus faecium]|uniref:BppU family phage baseplate upper protein n=2 Tax=Enterococcus faecium TaxID=1352 RepID=UPI002542A8F4|nr:BppU family phage baseplate upper protein [Enterococcus faecium]MDK4370497.1 phage baseplate upper protein [Enterococcus faecium]
MAHVIKKGSIKVPTQPKDYDLQATGLVFKSYDNQIALEFNVEQQNGTPADLLGANLRLLMFIYDEVDGMITKEPIPFITKNLITESFLNGQVVYILPEAMKAYNGMVEAYVYIEYPDGSTSDNLGFTFRMKRSAIDGLAQDKADYFIADFQQLLDGVKQEATDAVNETLAKVEAVSENVSSAQNDLTILEDRIDHTNQQIGDLGKLKKMYSNSIDFGDYDYSGNPNIAPNVGFNDFYNNGSQTGYTAKDGVDHIAVTRTADAPPAGKLLNLRTLLPNKTYSLSVDIWADMEVPSGAISCNIRLREGTEVRSVWALINKPVGTNRTTYSVTFTTAANFVTTEESRISLWFNDSAGACTGYLGYNIKIEEGSTATPYQPNLLDAPYYLSKVALGEDIANKDVQFPITTTEYSVYSKANVEDYKVNQKYVLTMKATKPAIQRFIAYLNGGTIKAADLYPVEGLTDTWQGEFTVTQASIDAGALRTLAVYQFPSETKGTVKIDWLKIEKGDTRTPNISQFKYFGEGLKDSNNPNDYSWDITAEYTEKGLNDSVSLTEPQSVDGTKNFLETPLVNGKNVLVEEKPLPYEAWHSTGTEQTGISNKARLIIGPVATTIGAKLNRSMKENPLTWNSGNWQATANRDCTLLVEGLVRYQFGGSTAGQYGYITFYKDDAQTSSIGFAGGVGINGTALQWKHGLHFSRIFALKKGEYFNITFETQEGKKLDFSQINTLHIMEIES